MAVLRSGNARETMEALKNENLSLQKQFADLLAAHGLTRADIEPQYTCKRCEDTGYVDLPHLLLLPQFIKADRLRKPKPYLPADALVL